MTANYSKSAPSQDEAAKPAAEPAAHPAGQPAEVAASSTGTAGTAVLTGRSLVQYRLRPETVQAYIRYHVQVWPELLTLYREAGITDISCFLSGLDLVVYVQYEQERYEAAKETLSRNPVEMSWQALMRTLHDPHVLPQYFKEVYWMPSAPRETSP